MPYFIFRKWMAAGTNNYLNFDGPKHIILKQITLHQFVFNHTFGYWLYLGKFSTEPNPANAVLLWSFTHKRFADGTQMDFIQSHMLNNLDCPSGQLTLRIYVSEEATHDGSIFYK